MKPKMRGQERLPEPSSTIRGRIREKIRQGHLPTNAATQTQYSTALHHSSQQTSTDATSQRRVLNQSHSI